MKGDKMARRSSFGSIMRRRLSDVTNSLPQPKSLVFPENLPPDTSSAKELIDHLVKEKMTLVKLIQDKNKIIELSGIEIQNMRNCLQKMQLQNWSLAQANSHMLAELNLGKERLKALQHEIKCKEALLKTKAVQLKDQEEVNAKRSELQELTGMNKGSEINEDTRPCKASTRRHPSRSLPMGSPTVSQSHAEKEAAVSKRRCLRRQSARFRIEHEEQAENLFEIDEAKFPPVVPTNSPNNIVGGGPSPNTDHGSSNAYKPEGGARRTSTSRPSRKATEKVQSYKEIPLNIKMRRSE